MRRVSGIITVLQEGRFRLAIGDGGSMLFTLDRASRIEPQDLPCLLGRGCVQVAFTTGAGREGFTAHDIRIGGGG